MITKKIALAMGDGSGPEMMEQACIVVEKAAKFDNIEIAWHPTPMGWNAFDDFGDTLPKESLDAATEIGTLFFGGVGDTALDDTLGKKFPSMKPEARCLLTIRKKWELLLNFMPMTFSKAMGHIHKIRYDLLPDEPITQHWVRYLLEDTYFGTADLHRDIFPNLELMLGIKDKAEVNFKKDSIITDLAYFRRETLERYFRYIFNHAKKLGLPVISVDKSNVMARYVLWRQVCTHIHETEFPEIGITHKYVDATNELLFTPAALHAVIACGNEHGDILSDGAAGACGSLGMMCSSAINPENGMAMFESGAGTAPTIAGRDIANPIGRILTGAMMLDHIGAPNGAEKIQNAVDSVLLNGYRTVDIASQDPPEPQMILGTRGITEAILREMAA